MNWLFLLAQTEAASPLDVTHIQGWLQLASSAGFAGLTWYLIAMALPAMQKRFDEHSDKQMAAFTSQVQAITNAMEKQLDRVLKDRG